MNIEELLNTYSLYLIYFGATILIILAIASVKATKLTAEAKRILFIAICIATLLPTIAISASTVYINMISSSRGPVHWHADFEVWKCGKELDLIDPKGLSNKIGTTTLHEHNDKRIHLEGVVIEPLDASLGKFFDVIGGHIDQSSFSMPTTEGLVSATNGESCEGQTTSTIQVFVYQTDKDNNYVQEKLQNPQSYVIAPFSGVPAGDCIIVEFGEPKEKTDRICRSYKVAEEIGKVREGAPHGH